MQHSTSLFSTNIILLIINYVFLLSKVGCDHKYKGILPYMYGVAVSTTQSQRR